MRLPIRDPDDKRRADRAKVELDVEVFDGERSIAGKLMNISVTGLGFSLVDRPSSDEVEVRIHIPGGDGIILKGRIVWMNDLGIGWQVGVSDLNASEEDKEKFLELLVEAFLNTLFSISSEEGLDAV